MLKPTSRKRRHNDDFSDEAVEVNPSQPMTTSPSSHFVN